jgi:hypothetical protein
MQEKIEKPEIGNTINLEKTKAEQENTCEAGSIKERNESDRENLLNKIYGKENTVNVKSEVNKTEDSREEKTIINFVKEFYSIGSKAIEKARKVLGAHGIDKLHDEITNKNKSSHKQ